MKKALLIVVVTLMGCAKQAKQTAPTDNNNFKVEFLFEVDGCKVYRFFDMQYRYFTTCNGSTQWTESHGKTSVDMQVPTTVTDSIR